MDGMHGHMHGEMLRHYETWLWVLNNFLTGLSYVLIGTLIARSWTIQARFGVLFAMFIVACGVHHMVHAMPGMMQMPHGLIASAQIITDVTMTSVSCLTALLVYRDWLHSTPNRQRRRRDD